MKVNEFLSLESRKTLCLATLLLCFFACWCNFVSAQNKNKDYYRFNFYPLQVSGRDWQQNSQYQYQGAMGFLKDSSAIFSFIPNPIHQKFRAEIRQRLLLSPKNGETIKVRVLGAGDSIQKTMIKLTGINKEESIICTSLKDGVLSNHPTWQEVTISPVGMHLLDIAIYAEGYQGKKALMRLFKIDILIGNTSIAEQDAEQLPIFSLSEATPFSQFQSRLCNTSNIPIIVGFGESVHGNSFFRDLVYNNIYQWIKQKETTTILLEFPMEQALAYNQYIHNPDYKLRIPLIDIATQQLLDSLRLYNSKNPNNTVSIIGIDFNRNATTNQNTLIDLFDFLISIPNWNTHKAIYPFLCKLFEGNDSIAYQMIVKQKEIIEKMIGKISTQCIERSLSIYSQLPKSQIKENYRDSIMAENVVWIQKSSTDKLLPILAHAEHVSKSPIQSFSLLRPMGNYLKSTYGKQYLSLMVSCARGNASTQKGDMVVTTIDLDNPPAGSVEYAGLSLSNVNNCWYTPTASFPNTLQYGRFMGNTYTAHSFYPMNIQIRFDGIIFTHLAVGTPMRLSIEDGYKQFLLNKQQRKKIYDAIRGQ